MGCARQHRGPGMPGDQASLSRNRSGLFHSSVASRVRAMLPDASRGRVGKAQRHRPPGSLCEGAHSLDDGLEPGRRLLDGVEIGQALHCGHGVCSEDHNKTNTTAPAARRGTGMVQECMLRLPSPRPLALAQRVTHLGCSPSAASARTRLQPGASGTRRMRPAECLSSNSARVSAPLQSGGEGGGGGTEHRTMPDRPQPGSGWATRVDCRREGAFSRFQFPQCFSKH